MNNTTDSYSYKKLNFLYEVIDTFTAGIILIGPEVKALTFSGGDINSSYCKFFTNGKKQVLKLVNTKITLLENYFVKDYKDNSDRLLLLNKSELNKIKKHLDIKGHTCVPSKLYRNKIGLWKVDICIVKPLKQWDKRDVIKKRDLDRSKD